MKPTTLIRYLGRQDYSSIWQKMQQFTLLRDQQTADEIWITEHPPVYTQGLNGKPEHLLYPTEIPVVATDRGGQITYHGPGQLVVYTLIDLKRLNLSPRHWVTLLEQAIIDTLKQYGILAQIQAGAPGVYIAEKKIASLGLRIKRGCCYHGLSLNNAMDLTPFQAINPCGYPGLAVTQLADLGVHIYSHELAVPVVHQLIKAIES